MRKGKKNEEEQEYSIFTGRNTGSFYALCLRQRNKHIGFRRECSIRNWQQYGGIWRYLKSNGTFAANGWEYINGKWYYFDAYGNMAANQWIVKADNPHIYYYVGPNGDMLTNQYIGQWYVNANGECYF